MLEIQELPSQRDVPTGRARLIFSVTVLEGSVLTGAGLRPGRITFDQFIESVEVGAGETAPPYLMPGFIDTHVHGGAGADTMDGPEGVRRLARFHLRHGTTTLLPTSVTAPWEKIVQALEGVAQVREEADPELPEIPGAHLEGPFISSSRLGAQPPYPQAPVPEKLDALLELDVVRLVTLAPEVPGALRAARTLAAAGWRIGIGHTVATFEQVQTLCTAVREVGGTVGFTHLFNAMGGMMGREPGVVGAALADADSYAELILDTHHVHPGSFLAALAAKAGRLHLITDAIRACGSSDVESELGGLRVTVTNGVAQHEDGTLAGSLLTLDQALRNAVGVGVGLERAARLLSEVPATYLGLDDRGRLEEGLRADLIALDGALKVREVYVAGRKLVEAQA